jgi:hypothetical protein
MTDAGAVRWRQRHTGCQNLSSLMTQFRTGGLRLRRGASWWGNKTRGGNIFISVAVADHLTTTTSTTSTTTQISQ